MNRILLIRTPGGKELKVALQEGREVSIGRGSGADVRIEDDQVSRKHLAIHAGPEGVAVSDLQSRNGTLLNGEKIETRIFMKQGDVVRAGDTEIVLCETVQRREVPAKPTQSLVCLSCGQIGADPCRVCGTRFSIPASGIKGLRLAKLIGKGGMGLVFRGYSEQEKADVALKVLAFSDSPDPGKLRRFFREARVQAKFRHGNVVRILGTGLIKSGPADRPTRAAYIVMEYVNGLDLLAIVKEKGPMEIKLALRTGLKVADVLAEAYRQGVVHRDIKPANIMLSASGVAKVMDFGLAKCLDGAGLSNITVTGSAFGTPAYMAPEQIHDAKHAGHAADIYSFGGMMFFLVTGRHPFEGGKIAEMIKRILIEKPAALSAIRPDAPPRLCAIVAKCLEKKPGDRYANAEMLQKDLENAFFALGQ